MPDVGWPASPTTRQTRGGQTLTAELWAVLETAYAAAGLDPALYLVVTQGSYKAGGGAAASGSTHDAGGAADLRVWNLPSSARVNLCEQLVVELRRRGCCAWYRDEAPSRGGMDPHIHVIYRYATDLSSGAVQQRNDYDAGRNGLSNKGNDYHPRPAQARQPYPPQPAAGVPARQEEDDTMIVIAPTGSWWLLTGGHLCSLTSKDGQALAALTGGSHKVEQATWDNLRRTYPPA